MIEVARDPLDLPIWGALNGDHVAFAVGTGARRYCADVSPFIAWPDADPATIAAARALVGTGMTCITMQTFEPTEPPGLTIVDHFPGVQMVAAGAHHDAVAIDDIVALGGHDSPDMVELARRTRPGPFLARTHLLGQFWGIRSQGKLVAMAGERLRVAAFSELSGVCTDPAARGQGLAGRLSRHVMNLIVARGETPILHAFADNPALRLYEELGFHAQQGPYRFVAPHMTLAHDVTGVSLASPLSRG